MGVSKNLKLFFYQFSAKMWLLYLIWDFFARKSVHSRVSLSKLFCRINLKISRKKNQIFNFIWKIKKNIEKFKIILQKSLLSESCGKFKSNPAIECQKWHKIIFKGHYCPKTADFRHFQPFVSKRLKSAVFGNNDL